VRDDLLRDLWLSLPQARLRARTADPGFRARADDGGEPAASAPDLAWRPERVRERADQPGVPDRGGVAAGCRCSARDPLNARTGLAGVAPQGHSHGSTATAPLLEIAQVRSALALLRGHQVAVPAHHVIFLAHDDVIVGLGTVFFVPGRIGLWAAPEVL